MSWDAIECLERNGEVTHYAVVFQQQGGAEVPGEVNATGKSFTAIGLTPNTNYIFRVAGVNSNGTGPFSDNITIFTENNATSRSKQFEFGSLICTPVNTQGHLA